MSENAKGITLFAVCCLLSFLVTVPQTRNALLALQQSDKRTVLATLDYSANNTKYRVVKLKVANDIFVEIYKLSEIGEQSLQIQFSLPYSRDAHFGTDSSLSNLFQTNLDDDSQNEIIVPILDENLVSHFTVIKYDKNSSSFSHFDFSEP
ncbi:MAG: hypothetical protein IT287_07655 [Bdellovibrionaceae bacterium]|nr:hypothetical protein [Pseudobdellovibrionaceae bacterium]